MLELVQAQKEPTVGKKEKQNKKNEKTQEPRHSSVSLSLHFKVHIFFLANTVCVDVKNNYISPPLYTNLP